jgi:hypothetical protein
MLNSVSRWFSTPSNRLSDEPMRSSSSSEEGFEFHVIKDSTKINISKKFINKFEIKNMLKSDGKTVVFSGLEDFSEKMNKIFGKIPKNSANSTDRDKLAEVIKKINMIFLEI